MCSLMCRQANRQMLYRWAADNPGKLVKAARVSEWRLRMLLFWRGPGLPS